MEEKSKKTVRAALGRGLSALISQSAVPVILPNQTEEKQHRDVKIIDIKPKSESTPLTNEVVYLSIDKITNNPSQPRQEFKEAELIELAASIKKLGVLQPIVVRRSQNNVLFEIVAGERRWRASRLANISEVPVIIKDLSDREALEIAIVENVQREDLNPIEQATAYQRLIDEFTLSQEEVGERVGKDRTSVANILRLLKLPKEVQSMVQEGKLTLGHAKAILSIRDLNGQLSVAKKAFNEHLSVRALESLVSRVVVLDAGKTAKEKIQTPISKEKSTNLAETTERLRRSLGTKVTMKHQANGRGSIVLEYFSEAELERIVERICAQ